MSFFPSFFNLVYHIDDFLMLNHPYVPEYLLLFNNFFLMKIHIRHCRNIDKHRINFAGQGRRCGRGKKEEEEYKSVSKRQIRSDLE